VKPPRALVKGIDDSGNFLIAQLMKGVAEHVIDRFTRVTFVPIGSQDCNAIFEYPDTRVAASEGADTADMPAVGVLDKPEK